MFTSLYSDYVCKIASSGKQLLVNEDEKQSVPGDAESMTYFRRHTKDLDLNRQETQATKRCSFIGNGCN